MPDKTDKPDPTETARQAASRGGKKAAAGMTRDERRARARKAALARWRKFREAEMLMGLRRKKNVD